MLQNTALSLGYGTEGFRTQTAGEDIARQRFAQDLGLSTGLYQSGAGMLGQISPLTTSGFAPLQTQLGLASSVENLGQGALDIGTALGAQTSTAGARAGELGLLAARGAAPYQVAQQSYSPIGQILGGSSGIQQAGTQLGSWFNNMINFGGTPQGGYAQQGSYLSSLPLSGGTQQQQMLAAQNAGLF